MPEVDKIPLGTLRVEDEIGRGGYGVVHKCRLEHLDGDFAVKLFDPSPFNHDLDTARMRFFQEAELLFRLRHPYIVPTYGVGEHEGKPYILMEHFRGLNLQRARAASAPNPNPKGVARFIRQVCDALAFAHSRDVIHRDIKPTNLMVTKDDSRVLDFGIAAVIDPDLRRLTRQGGTPVGDSFSAPELAEEPRMLDPRCDIFSVGACWFYALTGRAPSGVNLEEVLHAANPDLSRDYQRVLLRCLAGPDKRYQTVEDLLSALRALKEGASVPQHPDEMDDATATVMGAVVEIVAGDPEGPTVYDLERRLGTSISRIRLGASLNRLRRLGLLTSEDRYNEWNNEAYTAHQPTKEGQDWVDVHVDRVEQLLKGIEPPQPDRASVASGEDDIPF